MTILNNRLIGILAIVAAILCIPFIAMQFTDEVNWSAFDFMVMGMLLLGTGLAVDLVIRKINKIQHKVVIIFVVLLAFLLIWAELAVGIFGSPFAGS